MEAEPTPVESGPPRWLRPIGVRLLVLIVAFLAVDVAFAALNTQAAKNPFTGLVAGVATAGAALFAYAKIVGWLEQRATPEVDPRSLRPQATRGLILGFALFSLTWLLIFIGNGYRAEWGSVSDMVATFGLMIGIAA